MRSTFSAQKTMATIRKAAGNALNETAIAFQGAMQLELSHPGSGRFYARTAATRAVSGLPYYELTAIQVRDISRRFLKSNAAGARSIRAGRRKLALRNDIGVHQASAPGEPPAIDTGTLIRSWQAGSSAAQKGLFDRSGLADRNPRIRVGTKVGYAADLEYGTRRVAPRPYAHPALEQFNKSGVPQAIMRAHVGAALAGKVGTGGRVL